MKAYRSLLIISLSIICNLSYSQENGQFLEYREVYGLKIEVSDSLITKKINCGSGLSNSKKHTLYKITVEEIMFSRDSTVYQKDELKEVGYCILSDSMEMNIGSKYYILAGNSSVEEYIVGFRLFKENVISNMENVNKHSIFQGLESCYQINLFDKIRLLLGVKENKIYKNKRTEKTKNKFYKYILEHSN